jgi:bile acid-coenzyme A ligase
LDSRVSPAWKAPTSGGSTGQPKLIVAGRAGAVEPDTMLRPFRLLRGQVQLTPGPLYHNGPFTTALGGTFLGQHVVILPRFDAHAALEAIGTYGVNYVNLVPTMMARMLRVIDDHPRRYDLSTLETLFHTAAPCPPWLKLRWIELLGPDKVYEAFGGTEGQAFTAISGEEWLAHRGSVGRPVAGQIRVLAAGGTPAAPGTVGEVIMRRPPGSPPAYRYIGAEAKAYDDGWESLGDMGWFDEDGYLYLAGRDTDLILAGGANVYPAEVEAAIMEHPDVLSCAVVGLPDHDLGQRVHAVVQIEPATDATVTSASLDEFVTERLARYKVPRSFHIVTSPLRDDAGKLRRSAVLAAERARLGIGEKGEQK